MERPGTQHCAKPLSIQHHSVDSVLKRKCRHSDTTAHSSRSSWPSSTLTGWLSDKDQRLILRLGTRSSMPLRTPARSSLESAEAEARRTVLPWLRFCSGCSVLIVLMVLLIRKARRQTLEWRRAFATWVPCHAVAPDTRSVACQRCDTSFVPDTEGPKTLDTDHRILG